MEASGVDSSVRVSVVIPTLNEAANLPHVLPRLPAGLHEVIVVDGHSTDGTVAVARRLRPDVRAETSRLKPLFPPRLRSLHRTCPKGG